RARRPRLLDQLLGLDPALVGGMIQHATREAAIVETNAKAVEGELLHQPQRGHALRIRVLAGLVQLKRQLCKASCKSGCITADIARQIEGSHIIKRYFELGKRQAPFGGMPGSTHLQTSIELVIIDLLERIDKLVVVLLVVEREEIERKTLDLGIALD